MTKRILNVISDQHLIPHGGIGQFVKASNQMFIDMGYKVDIACDKKPRYDDWLGYSSLYYPESPLPNTKHNKIFMFGDSFSFERTANFRDSIIEAFSNHIYDLVILNTPEAMLAYRAFDICDVVPGLFYTHQEDIPGTDSSKNSQFNRQYIKLIRDLIGQASDIKVGTQSIENSNLIANSSYLPMPLPENLLLEGNDIPFDERKGVLFVGRYEDRKGAEDFVSLIKNTNLPARILTNDNGARKFKKDLEGFDVEIGVSLTGKDKVDFIKESRIHFNPAKKESFGYAFFECAHLLPVVCYDKQWINTFTNMGLSINITDKKNKEDLIEKLYNDSICDDRGNLDVCVAHNKTIPGMWMSMVNSLACNRSNSGRSKIFNYDSISVNDFFKKELKRDVVGIEDIKSLFKCANDFQIIHTDELTFFSKDGTIPEVETQNTLF